MFSLQFLAEKENWCCSISSMKIKEARAREQLAPYPNVSLALGINKEAENCY